MKNKEKFAEELIALRSVAVIEETGEISVCCGLLCSRCLFNKKSKGCDDVYNIWLDEEYVEPRVEFEEMEIIEVSANEKDWRPAYFLRYCDYDLVEVGYSNKKPFEFLYRYARKMGEKNEE